MTSILALDDTTRAITQLAAHAGAEGIPDDDIRAACEELEALAVNAGIWHAWLSGRVQIGWSTEEECLIFRSVPGGPNQEMRQP